MTVLMMRTLQLLPKLLTIPLKKRPRNNFSDLQTMKQLPYFVCGSCFLFFRIGHAYFHFVEGEAHIFECLDVILCGTGVAVCD